MIVYIACDITIPSLYAFFSNFLYFCFEGDLHHDDSRHKYGD